MLEIVQSGGWLMLPLVLCSIVALGITVERLISLSTARVVPPDLVEQISKALDAGDLDTGYLRRVRESSPLGTILAAGLLNAGGGRDAMREAMQEEASAVVHALERNLNGLGTIAAVAPLLGLLGTVTGMIRVFSQITLHGAGNAAVLAGGISEALVTTASGLAIAIPALMLHRFFLRRLETLVLMLEQDAGRLLAVVHKNGRRL